MREKGKYNGMHGWFYPRKPDREVEKTAEDWAKLGRNINKRARASVLFCAGNYRRGWYSIEDTHESRRHKEKSKSA